MTQLRTSRLTLREWRDSDLEPFAALNADPDVMRQICRKFTKKYSTAQENFAKIATWNPAFSSVEQIGVSVLFMKLKC